MDPTARIARMIAPTLEDMGYVLVRVRFTGGGRPVLQIMAERAADGSMTVENCAEVSGAVSALLDVEDPIPGHYDLEVSSPGLDRPLVRIGDFERFAGFVAKIEMTQAVNGRKRFRGRILGVADGVVRIAADEGECELPFADIANAKLVITDDLIEASLKRQQS